MRGPPPSSTNPSSSQPPEALGLVLGSARGPGPTRPISQLAKSHDGTIRTAGKQDAMMTAVAQSLQQPNAVEANLRCEPCQIAWHMLWTWPLDKALLANQVGKPSGGNS